MDSRSDTISEFSVVPSLSVLRGTSVSLIWVQDSSNEITVFRETHDSSLQLRSGSSPHRPDLATALGFLGVLPCHTFDAVPKLSISQVVLMSSRCQYRFTP